MNKQITIIGAGALGSNIAYNIMRDRNDVDLTVVDFDVVEERNYRAGTQVYQPQHDGMPKVEALQLIIYVDTQKKVSIQNQRVAGGHDFGHNDLIIDCTDNVEARELLHRVGLDSKNVMHVGFSDQKTYYLDFSEKYDPPTQDPTGDICEAQGARGFIQMVSGIATNIVYDYLDNGRKVSAWGNSTSLNTAVV